MTRASQQTSATLAPVSRTRERNARGLATLIAIAAGLLTFSATASAVGPVEFTIGAATGVLPASATLHGTVNPNAATIESCEFEYGPGLLGYNGGVPCSSTPSGSAPEAVSAEVTELRRDTAYRYRLVVRVEGAEIVSSEGLFLTPPTVVGRALASNVTSRGATLTGLLGAGEVIPTYHFAYGLTSAYGSSVPSPDAATGTFGFQSALQTLTGLQPGTTYHFALVASNTGGEVSIGPEETFTTRPLVPPAVSTGPAEAVGQKAATFTGAVNPEGLDTTYSFQYGTSTAYGSGWPSVPAHAGDISGSEAAAVAVENLQPETTYHYRLIASNEDGTSYGADQTFTTAPRLVSVIQEAPVAAPQPGLGGPRKETRPSANKHKKHRKKRGAGHRKARKPTKRGKKK